MYRARGARQTLRQTWTNRVFPPLIAVAVIGSVWYAVTNRGTNEIGVTAGASPNVANAQPVKRSAPPQATLSTPTVQKLNGKVTFSIDTKKVSNVQKVEFYVSNRLVGAVYGAPYTVSVSENILQPGAHQVVAKVYTENTTASTPPASFTADIQPGPTPDSNSVIPTGPAVVTPPTDSSSTDTDSIPADTTPPPTTVTAPTNINATVIDGPVVQVTWDAPDDTSAVSYQVWRDSDTTPLGSTTDTFYSDPQVVAGESHNYYIVSVGSDGTVSGDSTIVHVVIPPTDNDSGTSGTAPSESVPQDTETAP